MGGSFDHGPEQILTGGSVNAVVRTGPTVRQSQNPAQPAGASVAVEAMIGSVVTARLIPGGHLAQLQAFQQVLPELRRVIA